VDQEEALSSKCILSPWILDCCLSCDEVVIDGAPTSSSKEAETNPSVNNVKQGFHKQFNGKKFNKPRVAVTLSIRAASRRSHHQTQQVPRSSQSKVAPTLFASGVEAKDMSSRIVHHQH